MKRPAVSDSTKRTLRDAVRAGVAQALQVITDALAGDRRK
jgi:hypothetical protein